MKDTNIRSADLDLGYFDLNTVSEKDLASIPDVGPERARELIQNRPYDSIEAVAMKTSCTDEDVDMLRRAGAFVGEPAPPIGVS